jgi:DNA-binding LacI/PurR family transcriptional regulator
MPDDVALMGFDDTFAASVVTPQLSTVSQRQYGWARRHRDGTTPAP